MWRYYCCNGIGSCCDVDHLTMHVFFIALIGSVGLFGVVIDGSSSTSSTSTDAQIPVATYFGGMGFSIAVCVWAFWQINRILGGRMDAAKIMDVNMEFKQARGNFGNNIAAAQDVKQRLEETHLKTAETTDLLKQKFIDLKTWTDQSKIITDQSSKVAILLADKIYKMEKDIEDELIASEKGVIEALYDSMHLEDGIKGLDENEFKEFLRRLPKKYKERFKFDLKFNFEQEAGTDGILDRRELDKFMEQTIREIALEQEAKNVPIGEEINGNVDNDVEKVDVPFTGDQNEGDGANQTTQ